MLSPSVDSSRPSSAMAKTSPAGEETHRPRRWRRAKAAMSKLLRHEISAVAAASSPAFRVTWKATATHPPPPVGRSVPTP
ncbi:hypothetical protein MA16_Dca028811 [Dendrobium catenatum]|uniref:Uncharacterized protein n=1 Tax=Dendrobium catenatum TaxID=906689 RepID=A0A2I0VFY2_9ASPA|nr:hypothetical protein MA16_Dca028811 [Dendrobium catenatum]